MILTALDLHAHIEPTIAPRELADLNAVVFAVTRSLDEAQGALSRHDLIAVWGVGCHPGLVGAHKSFSAARFSKLLDSTALVGEVGLDGRSRVPMATQIATLGAIFEVLSERPRISTIHSYSACGEVLELLEQWRPVGVVLHWWLGTPAQTSRAIDFGCYFSVNAAMLKHRHILKGIPLERLLTETDHPFGDRQKKGNRRPGAVEDVELAIAGLSGLTHDAVRLRLWQNLKSLVDQAGTARYLPESLRARLNLV